MNKIVTLDEFILQRQKDFPYATGELSGLLRDIGLAAKIIHRSVNKAGLADILGKAGSVNIQGEEVQKLDEMANAELIAALQLSGECAGIASEEEDEFMVFEDVDSASAAYVVVFDPLDGSSNIDVNVSIGTIFSIYRREDLNKPVSASDFLRKGSEQVAAGYVIYGSSTMLVYTTGKGVNGFTLDSSLGEFCLSHPDIKTPEMGKIYSVNQGNYHKYDKGVQDYIDHCMSSEEGGPYSHRYIGSGVADFHRNLIKGGIFMYPALQGHPNGKLRIVYECNPLAFIQEQAGGLATDGFGKITDIKPDELHQRVPLYIGSKNMVETAMKMMKLTKVES